MKRNAPNDRTFWVSIILAVAGVAVYGSHLLINRVIHHSANLIPYLQPTAFGLVVIAFVLLCLGLYQKGL